MKKIFSSIFAAAFIFALIWLGVIIWWQETHRVVSGTDVVLWMGVLPLAVVLLLLAARALYRWWKRPPAVAAAGAASASVAAAASPEPTAHLAVAAIGWCGAAGDDVEAAVAALGEGAVEPQIDNAVRDSDGLPVLLARHAGLDLANAATWLKAQGAEAGDERLQRSLSLLQAALAPVLEGLQPLFLPVPPGSTARPRMLRLGLVQPAGFDEPRQRWLQQFVVHQLAEAGVGPLTLNISWVDSSADHHLLKWVDQIALQIQREALDDVVLLVAADSALDALSLADAADRAQLYSAKRPQGRVPGEAAAALVLTAPSTLVPPLEPLALLHRPLSAERQSAIDAKGKVDDTELAALVTQCFTRAGADAKACARVCSDTGPSAPRVEELALTLARVLPDLDVVADRIDITTALGHVGAAKLLSLMALAAEATRAEQKPVLLAGLSDRRQRFALLVTVQQPVKPSA